MAVGCRLPRPVQLPAAAELRSVQARNAEQRQRRGVLQSGHRRADARGRARPAENPQLASRRWAGVDHALVDAAPWLPLYNRRGVVLTAQRVGGYRYHPIYGALLDQLWVR